MHFVLNCSIGDHSTTLARKILWLPSELVVCLYLIALFCELRRLSSCKGASQGALNCGMIEAYLLYSIYILGRNQHSFLAVAPGFKQKPPVPPKPIPPPRGGTTREDVVPIHEPPVSPGVLGSANESNDTESWGYERLGFYYWTESKQEAIRYTTLYSFHLSRCSDWQNKI